MIVVELYIVACFFFFLSAETSQNTAERRKKTEYAGTVNALRVAWLINLMAAWLVSDATINIFG